MSARWGVVAGVVVSGLVATTALSAGSSAMRALLVLQGQVAQSACQQTIGQVSNATDAQTRNAQIIVAGSGGDAYAARIAVAVSIVEAGLLNQASLAVPESLAFPHDKVAQGDRDSVGLFQQRAGWGSVAQRMDPATSTGLFYAALRALPDWATMGDGQAAQAVQRSAYPGRYNEVLGQADDWLTRAGVAPLASVDCEQQQDGPVGGGGSGSFTDAGTATTPRPNPRAVEAAIEWARAEAASGRSIWYRRCLAFVAQSYGWSFSGVSYAIDHYSVVPPEYRHPADGADGRTPPPGALLYWDTGARAGHVALYVGGGMIASNDIEVAGQIGVVPADRIERDWGARYVGWTMPLFPNGG